MKKLIAVLLMCLSVNVFAQSKMIFTSDFESGKIQSEYTNPDGWSMQNGDQGTFPAVANATVVKCPTPGVVTVVPVPKSGKCLVEFNLTKSDWPRGTLKPRAQLKKSPDGPAGLRQHVEYCASVSTYHPTNWQFDTNTNNQTVFVQMHGFRGAEGMSPPLAMTLKGKELIIVNRSGNQAIKSQFNNIVLWRGTLELGKWTDWKFHFKFSQTGTDGFVEVYRNGVLIGKRLNAPTLYYTNTPSADDMAYQLLSLYKGKFVSEPTSVTKNTFWYDNFKLAQGVGCMDLVK